MPPPDDKQGFRFYQEILGNAKFVLAPMVDASELAWRMLARKYSAQLCTYNILLHTYIILFYLLCQQDVNCND